MYEKIFNYCKELDSRINRLEKEINSAPKGFIQCHTNGAGCKWFYEHEDGSHATYIKKSENEKARKLARKTLARAQLLDAVFERNALEYYISNSELMMHTDALLRNKGFRHLLAVEQHFNRIDIDSWANASYSSTADHPEHLTVPSASGRMVRSKSEAFIDWELKRNNIPYRYECDLIINGQTFHPDFTILHPKTGETFIWEHLGLMDSPSYAKTAFSKFQAYYSAGYIPMVNLIITSETSIQPLDSSLVIKLIEHYFS